MTMKETGLYRDQFYIPQLNGADSVYYCGNSLGLQPKNAQKYIQETLDDWAKLGVEGHLHAKHPWLPYHEFVTAPMARLVGGNEREVVVMNSLSVNLHLLLASFYKPNAYRNKILIESDAFPSDRYVVASQAQWHGYDPEDVIVTWSPPKGKHCLEIEDLQHLLQEHGESIAVIMLGGVNYYTGQYLPIEYITRLAHSYGITVGWDLAHAAGNVPLHLHDWEVDFAAWCSYKYLNSSPGGLSGIFIHENKGLDSDQFRLSGWWGHNKETRFKMRDDFEAIPGAEGWQLSNPPILPLAAMRASLELFDKAGIQNLRNSVLPIVNDLYKLLSDINGINIITPSEEEYRGCQLSILVENEGKALFEKLTSAGVIADWREPNVIRIAHAPLYNNKEDAIRFVQIIESLA